MTITRNTLLLVIIALGCDSQGTEFGMPAEWDRQKAIFVNYAGNPRDAITSEKVHVVCRDIIRELSFITKVYVLINEEFDQDSLRRVFALTGIQTENVILLPVYSLFSMGVPRDYGPMITKNINGESEIIQFQWDYVGADFINPDTLWTKRRDFIRDKYFTQMSKVLRMEVRSIPLTIEGGEIELNGKGTALLVESFNSSRNPHITRTQLDSLLYLSLGVKKTIWLHEGVAEDPGTGRKSRIYNNIYGYGVGGHVDEFARFANDNTILLAMPSLKEAKADPVKMITYDRMKANALILEQSTDQDGKKLNVIYIPVPDVNPETYVVDTTDLRFPVRVLIHDFPEWNQGETIHFIPAISYLNFIVFNQLVIIPKYWRTGFPETCKEKDRQVRNIFADLFPGKKIVQIDTWGMNRVGGGIHCWTQQVPED